MAEGFLEDDGFAEILEAPLLGQACSPRGISRYVRRRQHEVCIARPHGGRDQPAHEPSASFRSLSECARARGLPGSQHSCQRHTWAPDSCPAESGSWGRGRVSRPDGDRAGPGEPKGPGGRLPLGTPHLTV